MGESHKLPGGILGHAPGNLLKMNMCAEMQSGAF